MVQNFKAIEIIDSFLSRFGHERGGSIRMDQGGELARSFALSDRVLRSHNYILEPTGADSPSQNGAVEIYITSLPSGHVPYCTAQDFQPNTGRQLSSIRCVSITTSLTKSQRKHHWKGSMAPNRTYATSNYLAPGCV